MWAQLFFAATCLSLFAFPYIHVGSAKDGGLARSFFLFAFLRLKVTFSALKLSFNPRMSQCLYLFFRLESGVV